MENMPKEVHNIRRLEPVVHERKFIQNKNILFALFIGVIVIMIQFSFVFFFGLSLKDSLIIGFILILFYGIFLLFLVEPRVIREIHNLEVKTIERPSERIVFKEVEKPVVPVTAQTLPAYHPTEPREIVRTVEKRVPVYIEKPRAKLNIPKYEYLGSSETKTFHSRNCRLGKLIKKKYKVSNNSKSYFTSKKYKPCKVCILKKKKV